MKAIYPGTFEPFHVGHLNVFQKAEAIFDDVKVIFAHNGSKEPKRAYKEFFLGDMNYDAVPKALGGKWHFLKGSLTKYIESLDEEVCIVRGLRNSSDLPYEQNYLRWLESLTTKKLNAAYILCDREYDHISSSAILDLVQLDRDEAMKYVVK